MDGGTRVSLTPLNLNEVIETCLRIQHSAAMEKLITIRNTADPEICILADLDMLKLVMRNLINNAIKFTRSGGEIVISNDIKDGCGVLTIQDNGIGISPEQQKNLFSMETSSTYGTNNEKGVGLGLMLCKEFTEMQGGNISFTSCIGEGTTFNLSFPLHKVKVADIY